MTAGLIEMHYSINYIHINPYHAIKTCPIVIDQPHDHLRVLACMAISERHAPKL